MMARKVPRLKSDAEAEAFLDSDLSGLDFSQFKPMHFKYRAKTARVNLWLDRDVLDFFRSHGRGYQTRINAVLRVYADRTRPRHNGRQAAKGRKKSAR
jgi:uncharacterized protein (DUF4415 family)